MKAIFISQNSGITYRDVLTVFWYWYSIFVDKFILVFLCNIKYSISHTIDTYNKYT